MEEEYRIYVGIDWASEAHQACVLDHTRRIVAERSFAHAGDAILAFAQWLGELAKDSVQASRLAGAGTLRLMFDTVLPNCAAPLIVQATLGFSSAILDAAALGFLGLGAQPPTPEWGSMLASALEFIQSAWWVVTLPGLAILVTVLAFNLTGDGLRDALDPRLKR